MKDYILSVVIPTKNRQKYALSAAKEVSALHREKIQVVVHDNSNNNSLEQMIKNENLQNVTYIYCADSLSGVENFNRSLEYVKGEYVCMIGDDDGVLPEIVKCVEWMKDKNIDAVKAVRSIVYHWPGNSSNLSAMLRIYGNHDVCHKMDTMAAVIQLLKNGGQNYSKYDLAVSYHGIVKKACLDAVKRQTGKYFDGVSPDIYSAVCLSLLKDLKAYYINKPILISGICPKSTSADSAEGKHFGKLEDIDHLCDMKTYNWDQVVPYIYSVETVWAETALKALEQMGRQDLKNYFNRRYLINLLYQNNCQHYKELNEILGNNYDLSKDIKKITFKRRCRKLLSLLHINMREFFKIDTIYNEVQNIQQAYELSLKHVKNEEYRIE